MYGCEAWVMTEKTKQQLERWERKILRKIYGPIKDKNGWRIRSNSELTQLYKKPNIITLIKAKRIEWIGHMCSPSDAAFRKWFTQCHVKENVENKSPTGRPQSVRTPENIVRVRKLVLSSSKKHAIPLQIWDRSV
ncbi:hypothetical protein C0J52_18541 [Blattella germanica]|nr:hypothetical protein C0J52_18541 [Blattella germanica]